MKTMDITTFLIQCLNALQYGLLLFLVASGLTLIFGIMGVINLAHGSFYMIGAYMAFALAPLVGHLRRRLFRHAAGRAAARRRAGLPAGMGLLQLPVRARAPAAGADDLRADPGLRGAAQLLVGDDVHGVKPPDWLAGTIPLGD
jgi:branched-chain amino acid transport system permease protein